jgi:hypothetical protein
MDVHSLLNAFWCFEVVALVGYFVFLFLVDYWLGITVFCRPCDV